VYLNLEAKREGDRRERKRGEERDISGINGITVTPQS
jgi:hypothetical protein